MRGAACYYRIGKGRVGRSHLQTGKAALTVSLWESPFKYRGLTRRRWSFGISE